MPVAFDKWIRLKAASEHNLKSLSLSIPKYAFTVVTGVSGSGKSSLIFDTLYKAAEHRFLSTFSTKAQNQIGKIKKPTVEEIVNLSAAIAVTQKRGVTNARSTVGTLSGIYDLLRLYFARLGKEKEVSGAKINRSLFSFNSPSGACLHCKGLGKQAEVDPALLVADPEKSIRERCLKITAPNGYIIYSQVTIDVLDTVCQAEGFSVDIPWKDLTPEQKNIIWYGSKKIKIPFGKHPLESRMKWQGITAKPREEGYYKGIIPVMSEILKRDHNPNILRYSKMVSCPECHGSRLSKQALNINVQGKSINDLTRLNFAELAGYFEGLTFDESEVNQGKQIKKTLLKKINTLKKLGIDYLTIHRDSESLSGGEIQRIRIANQVNSNLCGVIYILDESSSGLQASEIQNLILVLRQLVENGNTVIAVAHEANTIKRADYLIDIGPGPGVNGGEVVFSGTVDTFFKNPQPNSLTWKYLNSADLNSPKRTINLKGKKHQFFSLPKQAFKKIKMGGLNTITGASNSGKSGLMTEFCNYFNENLGSQVPQFDKIITIDATPIGRTPRSNPATYTKLFDIIRDVFAKTDLAKANKFNRSRFSFNVKGGRCETCHGAGVIQTGMHFLDDVAILCDECNGKRFKADTLAITFQEKNIAEVLEMSVDEASNFFLGVPKALQYIKVLQNLGLGYLKLGQTATSLSGGEAQRLKLASELFYVDTGKTLYLLKEPCSGLHFYDVSILLKALQLLINKGNTIISIEHQPDFIKASDYLIDMDLAVAKTSSDVSDSPISLNQKSVKSKPLDPSKNQNRNIQIKGATTHNLKNLNLSLPNQKLIVFTGVSGSGKSSLVFDTLYAQSKLIFSEHFSPYIRSQLENVDQPQLESYSGLSPGVAIRRKRNFQNPRSTIGTRTGLYDYYRLLYARCGLLKNIVCSEKTNPESTLFSFNQKQGACANCMGLGVVNVGDPDLLITHPEKSILEGAMSGHQPGRFFGDPDGQFIATLKAVSAERKLRFDKPYGNLTPTARNIVLFGTGDQIYQVDWFYNRNGRKGNHQFQSVWPGFIGHIEAEYFKKKHTKQGEQLALLLKQDNCFSCLNTRLKPEALTYQFGGYNIAELAALSVSEAIHFFEAIAEESIRLTPDQVKISEPIRVNCLNKLKDLKNLGLAYLPINRLTDSLSGGEFQRVQLAGQLSSGLTDTMYFLDEPTIGLHPRDTEKLKNQLNKLRDLGNMVLVVEHDADLIQNADLVVDIGPGAAENGGEILAIESPNRLTLNSKSVTGPYLNGFPKLSNPNQTECRNQISIKGATANNLKNIDLSIPLNKIVCLTGVSGSGKTSLLKSVIANSAKLGQAVNCQNISGLNLVDHIIETDQKCLANNPLSSIATYSGVFDEIRTLFAKTESATNQNYKKNHFSYNHKVGRCDACLGMGKVKTRLDFLADVWSQCQVCGGKRYKAEILTVIFDGLSIADVLELTIESATHFFKDHPKIVKILTILEATGLGYIKLGQSISELSGGETQRLKLSLGLKQNQGYNLYLFDEPFTGLHFKDSEKLMKLFYQLQNQGHSIVIVEHNSWVIASSDWVIDLGPEGGAPGGNIIVQGTPERIAECTQSATATYVKQYFK